MPLVAVNMFAVGDSGHDGFIMFIIGGADIHNIDIGIFCDLTEIGDCVFRTYHGTALLRCFDVTGTDMGDAASEILLVIVHGDVQVAVSVYFTDESETDHPYFIFFCHLFSFLFLKYSDNLHCKKFVYFFFMEALLFHFRSLLL